MMTFQQVGRGSWRHWNDFIKQAVAEGKKFQDILIPTMDTVRYSYMMDYFIKHERYLYYYYYYYCYCYYYYYKTTDYNNASQSCRGTLHIRFKKRWQ